MQLLFGLFLFCPAILPFVDVVIETLEAADPITPKRLMSPCLTAKPAGFRFPIWFTFLGLWVCAI